MCVEWGIAATDICPLSFGSSFTESYFYLGGKESTCQLRKRGFVLLLGREDPLQCSCLENPLDKGAWLAGDKNAIDRGAWQAAVHRVTKSQTDMTFTGNNNSQLEH